MIAVRNFNKMEELNMENEQAAAELCQAQFKMDWLGKL